MKYVNKASISQNERSSKIPEPKLSDFLENETKKITKE